MVPQIGVGSYIGNPIGNEGFNYFSPELVRNKRKRSKNTFCTCPRILFFEILIFDIFEHFQTYLTIFGHILR